MIVYQLLEDPRFTLHANSGASTAIYATAILNGQRDFVSVQIGSVTIYLSAKQAEKLERDIANALDKLRDRAVSQPGDLAGVDAT